MRVAFDTSVLVAATQAWHPEHGCSHRALDEALERGSVIVPLHVLWEAYSVLTRLPRQLRLAPAIAFEVLERTLRQRAELVDLDAGSAFEVLDRLQQTEVAGGAAYDAVIAEAAHRAGAGSLLTLNPDHFQRVAPEGLEIVEP